MLALTLTLAALALTGSAIAQNAPAPDLPTTPLVSTTSALPAQSSVPDHSRDWDGPSTPDIIFFVAFILFSACLAFFLYKWTVRRRAAAARAAPTAPYPYGPAGFAYGQYGQDQGQGATYPPPPVYAQASYEPEPAPVYTARVHDDKPTPLGRALSVTSTASTLIGKDRKEGWEEDKDGSRLSEDEDERARPTLAAPQAAHRSSWRGRFARNGDQA